MNEQFRRHRFPTEYPVKIFAGPGAQQATVIDVNQSGARLIGLSDLKRGDQITMQVLTDRVRAIVRWHGADRTGISFLMPLPTRMVDTIRQSCSATGAWRFSSVDLREMR